MNNYQYINVLGTKQPETLELTCVSQLKEYTDRIVILHGSIYKIRKIKGFSFLILRTARFTVQCVCDSQEMLEQLQEEACVRMEAEVVKEERAKLGMELHVKKLTVLSGPTV